MTRGEIEQVLRSIASEYLEAMAEVSDAITQYGVEDAQYATGVARGLHIAFDLLKFALPISLAAIDVKLDEG